MYIALHNCIVTICWNFFFAFWIYFFHAKYTIYVCSLLNHTIQRLLNWAPKLYLWNHYNMGMYINMNNNCWIVPIGHVNNIRTMQFLLEFPEILSQNLICPHWLSVSGNSEIMYCGKLINMPYYTGTDSWQLCCCQMNGLLITYWFFVSKCYTRVCLSESHHL